MCVCVCVTLFGCFAWALILFVCFLLSFFFFFFFFVVVFVIDTFLVFIFSCHDLFSSLNFKFLVVYCFQCLSSFGERDRRGILVGGVGGGGWGGGGCDCLFLFVLFRWLGWWAFVLYSPNSDITSYCNVTVMGFKEQIANVSLGCRLS